MQKLLALDVDGIMTDDCALLKKIMEEKHKWPE
jgi:3-deoxy-D-manno-octulosonate 8-phosphate phosphatase KdsC-like HAD superfamily phosphatase